MSINIIVTVPLETLAAYSTGKGRDQATQSAVDAVIASMDALPYNITPKSANTAWAPLKNVPDAIINFTVKTVTGKSIAFTMHNTDLWCDLADAMQSRERIPTGQQRLIHGGRPFYSAGDGDQVDEPYYMLKECGVVDGSEIYCL